MSMTGYTKLFQSILASTIWRADDKTRIVWITLLAMADKNGVVEGSIPGLADFARVSLPDCLHALTELQGPDEFSRSKEHDGRRIEPIDGGWRLINHSKYRNKLSQDERREYLRQKQREYRRKQASTNVNNVSDESTLLTHTTPAPEATTDTNTKNGGGKQAAPMAETVDKRGRPAPIFGRTNPHKNHACCGKVCLHSSQFEELTRFAGNQTDPDAYVRLFFATWDTRYVTGDRSAEIITESDPFNFWRDRWAETHPKKANQKPEDTRRVMPSVDELRRRHSEKPA